MGLEAKTAVLRGQGELLHNILAKSHSKKDDTKTQEPITEWTQPNIGVISNYKSADIGPRREQVPCNFPKKVLQPGLKLNTPKSIPNFRSKRGDSTTRRT
ncbi:hypothetical protein SLA2020_348410 [Shorea laevis]